MRVSVEWCDDKNIYNYGYTFWQGKKIVARCDESDYHETVMELTRRGYIING